MKYINMTLFKEYYNLFKDHKAFFSAWRTVKETCLNKRHCFFIVDTIISSSFMLCMFFPGECIKLKKKKNTINNKT